MLILLPSFGGFLLKKTLQGFYNLSVEYSPKLWYQTDQFALEVIIHERMKLYRCVTKDRSLASAFYLPYYIGLDIARNLFTPHIQVRDKLSHQFVGWLLAQPEWRKRGGADHVFVLGRVVWDFYRKEPTNEWGVPLLKDPELNNMTKLLIERDPYSPTAKMVGIPYPTSFHPETDEDVRAWQRVVRESNRDNLVSFAGAPRKAEFHGQLRGTLLKQCMNYSRNCTLLDCSKVSCPRYPQFVTGLFLRSVFCLQPPGDSPTRKGIFDCLIAGCIPVFFSNDSAYDQYVWHLPRNGRSYSVFISEDQVSLVPTISLSSSSRHPLLPTSFSANPNSIAANAGDILPRRNSLGLQTLISGQSSHETRIRVFGEP